VPAAEWLTKIGKWRFYLEKKESDQWQAKLRLDFSL